MWGGYSGKFSRRQWKFQLSWDDLKDQNVLESVFLRLSRSLTFKILAIMAPLSRCTGFITNLLFWATRRLWSDISCKPQFHPVCCSFFFIFKLIPLTFSLHSFCYICFSFVLSFDLAVFLYISAIFSLLCNFYSFFCSVAFWII